MDDAGNGRTTPVYYSGGDRRFDATETAARIVSLDAPTVSWRTEYTHRRSRIACNERGCFSLVGL